MFEQLIQMATSQLSEKFVEHPDIPHQDFDYQGAAGTVGSSVFETLAGQVTSGNLDGIKEMLSGQNTSGDNPIVGSLIQNIIGSLTAKNGINPQLASTIASIAVPFIMNMFNKQAGEAQSGGMDIGGLIGSALGGGGNSGGGGLLGNLLGSVLGGGGNSGGSVGANVIGSILGQVLKR